MIDPTAARNDRLQRGSQWGYTGESLEDPMPVVDESPGMSRWLLWVALLAIVVIALFAFFGAQA